MNVKKKKATLSIAGSGTPQQKEIELVSGASLKDLKRDAGVPASYQVIRKSTGEQLRDGQDLCSMLDDNELLIAMPAMSVGGMRDTISRLFSFSQPKVRVINAYDSQSPETVAGQAVSIQPSNIGPIQVMPRAVVIPPELLGMDVELELMGWVRYGNEFHGNIADNMGVRYQAKIVKNYIGYQIFVHRPPRHVLLGSHGQCFRCMGNGWYWVHFNGESTYPPGMIRSLQDIFNSFRGY